MHLLEDIVSNVDIMYIVSCNAASYMVIKLLEGPNTKKKKKRLGTWHKRLVATVVAIVIALVMYYKFDHTDSEALFYGAFIQFLTWDYLFKPIVKSLPSAIVGGPVGNGTIDDLDP